MITFDSKYFEGTLMTMEAPEGKKWMSVDLEQILPEEAEMYAYFLEMISGDIDINWEDVGLVRMDEDGVPDKFYGPCLFSGKGYLELKVGANSFPVVQKGRDLEVNGFSAELTFETKSGVNGDWDLIQLVIDIPIGDKQQEFATNIRTNSTKVELKQALRDNKPLADLLSEAPESFSSGLQPREIGKMEDLVPGEYLISRINRYETSHGGSHMLLFTEKQGEFSGVWTKGISKRVLTNKWKTFEDKIASGVPMTLIVRGKKKLETGRWTVNHQICFRQPNGNRLPAAVLKPLALTATAVDYVDVDELPF